MEAGTGGFGVVAGTTASGKSALALALARRVDGVVVNADSVQLYRSLPLLTAQPSARDRREVPHLLYGILGDHERCSVAGWLDLAADAIGAVQPRLAIVTGGTGFYLEALMRGIADIPATPPALRQATDARMARLGREAFADALGERDPVLKAAGLPVDRQRLMRAWEVLELTGRSIRSFGAERVRPALPPFRGGVALVPSPAATAARISRRLEAMLDAGALDELRSWRADPEWASSPLAKADGVLELGAHLDGDTSLEAALEATCVKVRRYAKRQRTWLRHRLPELEVHAGTGEMLAAPPGQSTEP